MISIGITAPRHLLELDEIESGIDQAFSVIKNTFAEKTVALFSTLGSPADQLILDRGCHIFDKVLLYALLPLNLETYLANIHDQKSLGSFLSLLQQADHVKPAPDTRDATAAYHQVNNHLLGQVSVLLALWDGKHAPHVCHPCALVQLARENGLPLAWVHADCPVPGKEYHPLPKAEAGKLTLERFPED